MFRIIYIMLIAICYGFSVGFFGVHALNYFDIEPPSFFNDAAMAFNKPSPDKIIPSDWVLEPYSKK